MALIFQEHYKSGDGSLGQNAGDIYRILVKGDPILDNADDPGVIMLSAIPQFSLTSELGNIVTSFEREKIAPGTWIVTATYTSATEVRQSTTSQFSFTTSTGAAHITHSRATVNGYGPEGGSPPPNFQGAINVGADGSVEGVDIGPGTAQGTFEFKTTHYLPTLPQGLIDYVSAHPCSVNSSPVTILVDGVTTGAATGELQMQYCEGSKRKGFGDWELTFHWAISRNRSGFYVGNCIVNQKNGWDYLWVAYGPNSDPNAMVIAQQPIGVYIEQVYEYINLNLILIQLNTPGDIPWVSPTAGLPTIG